ncbi:MAG: carboxyltransferase domain-containing protein [Firmicutes bacterium]|nr:carboxyltransferase domain-containing protein [Bacillota bacterium]
MRDHSSATGYRWIGDSALLFERLSVTQRAALIRGVHPPEVKDVVSGLTDVVVLLESPLCDAKPVVAWARRVIHEASLWPLTADPSSGRQAEPDRRHVLAVKYGGPHTDLAEVAARLRLSPQEVVARHASREYQVLATGFAPGFAYCGDVDEALMIPRKAVPNPWVASGAVAMASRYTGVYPRLGAGGWWVLGHLEAMVDAPLWDFARRPPGLLNLGDTVAFVAV